MKHGIALLTSHCILVSISEQENRFKDLIIFVIVD